MSKTMLLAAAALCLTFGGCRLGEQKTYGLERPFSAAGRLYHGTLASGVTFTCQPEGIVGLTFASPPALSGLEMSISPLGYRTRLGENELLLPAEMLSEDTALWLLSEGFDALTQGDIPLRQQGEVYIGEGRTAGGIAFTVTVTPGGRLEKFSIPGEELDLLLFSAEEGVQNP